MSKRRTRKEKLRATIHKTEIKTVEPKLTEIATPKYIVKDLIKTLIISLILLIILGIFLVFLKP